jgi:hypothetical protein
MDETDHWTQANEILTEWCKPVTTTAEAIAMAQVHATLALADTLGRVADAVEFLGISGDQ